MPVRLSTLIASIDTSIPNPTNANLIREFSTFMKANDTSESYQKNNLKAVISFAKWLGNDTTLYEITKKEQIISFLDTKIQSLDQDPDKRWITTWNDYLGRIKFFIRWLYNHYKKKCEGQEPLLSTTDWVTPSFVQIRKKITKRISPYIENELL
jgi:integrase/recombinase XerD